jgi:Transposase DDE domain
MSSGLVRVEAPTYTRTTEDPLMIADFDEFCLCVYVVVDELYQRLQSWVRRPGPAPSTASDSELLAMAIIGECRGWDQETNLIAEFHAYRHLFPRLPSQSRFNRRRRNLMGLLNAMRRCLLQELDVAHDRQCVIDSLPIPVVPFHLAPQATHDWRVAGASYGHVASKKQTIYGYKLHLLVTLGGVIRDFELAPAHVTDLQIGAEVLAEHTDLLVLGDKGYVSAPVAAELAHSNRITLLAAKRRNQQGQWPDALRAALRGLRQIIETVNEQLTDQFTIERNHAHTFWGLCTRVHTKVMAHTLCIYLNRRLGNVDFLRIKQLAFPI